MNRADFLKRLGLGAIGIAVAPMVMPKESDEDIIKQEIKIAIAIAESPPAKVMLVETGWGATRKVIASGYLSDGIIYWDGDTKAI